MELLRDLSLIYSFVHIFIMFHALFESRYSKQKTRTIAACFVIPLIAINWLLFLKLGYEGYGILMLLTLSLPQCILYWILSKHRDGRFFFTYCMVDTVALEIFYVTNLINYYTTPDSYIVMFVLRLLIYPLIEFWAYKKLRTMYLEVQHYTKQGWGMFAVISVLFYIAITLQMNYPSFVTDNPAHLPVLALLFVLMLTIYIYFISALRRQQLAHEQSQQESIMRVQVANMVARLGELGEANQSFRKERHNFRHKLKFIASLVESEQYEELAKVVAEYEDSLNKTRVVRYCKSAIIDAALSVYIKKAESMGIPVKCGFAFPDTFEVNESELATALANAIENAINACEKLPKEERHIEIKVLSAPQFMIMVRNSFDGNVEFDERGIPQAQEEDHGFGTHTIAALCEKVGGYCDFLAEDKVFTLYMHLK